MDKIFDAKDYASGIGCADVRSWISKLSSRAGKPWDGSLCKELIYAEVNWGRWIAVCECGGAEAVSASYAWFYCCSCGNQSSGGAARPVVFPENIEAIETELSKRNGCVSGAICKPEQSELPRDWKPGETVKKLETERRKNVI